MKIFNTGNKSVNLYLLDTGTHRLLIDSGFPNQLHELGRAMRQTGYTVKEIDWLIVTHFHIDHAGAIQQLKNQGVSFLLFDIQAAHVSPMEKMAAGKWQYTPLQMEDHLILPVSASRQFLQSLAIAGEVIETPGHSADSISLVLDSGETFTGDLLAAPLVTDELLPEKKSWATLKHKGARLIYPGHGSAYAINHE